jgi:hypothetical protein
LLHSLLPSEAIDKMRADMHWAEVSKQEQEELFRGIELGEQCVAAAE